MSGLVTIGSFAVAEALAFNSSILSHGSLAAASPESLA